MIKPEHVQLGMEVISLSDILLSDDTIIPQGTLGSMERIVKLDNGRTVYFVHFYGFKNPNSPWRGIGVGLSEIEEQIDGA